MHYLDPPGPAGDSTIRRHEAQNVGQGAYISAKRGRTFRWPQICAFALMFCGSLGRILASMSEIDPLADAPLVDWSELGVSGLLPTGTVTLLLADVEGSTRLWETQPDQMTAAMARMNATVSETIATHDGVQIGRAHV